MFSLICLLLISFVSGQKVVFEDTKLVQTTSSLTRLYDGVVASVLGINESIIDEINDLTLNLSVDLNNITVALNNSFSEQFNSLELSLEIEHNQSDELLTSVYDNLTTDIGGVSTQVTNLDGDLVTHDSDIKSLLSSTESKIDLILTLLNITTTSLNLQATTIDCLEGTTWSIEVTATDNFENYLNDNDINCNVTTNLWGTSPLNWTVDSFDYNHECGYGNDTITWAVNCEEI